MMAKNISTLFLLLSLLNLAIAIGLVLLMLFRLGVL